MTITVPPPIYHKGWVIQPTKFGEFYVSDRRDHDRDTSMKFDSLVKARRYIDKKTRE